MRVQTPTFGGNFFSMILQESRSDNPTDLDPLTARSCAGSTPALGTISFTALCITFRNIILYLGLPDEGKMRDPQLAFRSNLISSPHRSLPAGSGVKVCC
jgi:hypothetical protein